MKKEESSLRIVTGYILFVAAVYLIFLVPLVMKNGYADIDIVKFDVYKWIVIVGYGLVSILALITFISEKNKLKKPDTVLGFTIGYLMVTVISTLVSNYRDKTLVGIDGWYMGLFAQVSFLAIFILHRYFDRYKKVLLYMIMFSAVWVYLFGVLHRYDIDPLDTYKLGSSVEMPVHYRMQFLSSVGQATWYSSFVAVSLPVVIGLYILCEKKWVRITSGLVITLGFMTMLTQNSDSAYMALAAIFTVYLCFSISDKNNLERFLEVCMMFLAANRLTRIGYYIFNNVELHLDKISEFMIFNNVMWPLIIVFLGILIYIRFVLLKKEYKKNLAVAFRNIYLTVLAFVFVVSVVLLVLDGFHVLPESITSITYKIPYLHWSDFWGSGRGKTWSFSVRMFGKMDLIHKLFGVGSDAYFYEAYGKFAEELNVLWPQDTITCAHNEWLNCLICQGILGVICYTGIFLGLIKEKIKMINSNPYGIICIAVATAYICHNFFCYQQVCSTPFAFMLMG